MGPIQPHSSRSSEESAIQESQQAWSLSGALTARISAGVAWFFRSSEEIPKPKLSWTAWAICYFIDQPESLEQELRSGIRCFFACEELMGVGSEISKIDFVLGKTVDQYVGSLFSALEAASYDMGFEVSQILEAARPSNLFEIVESEARLTLLLGGLREKVHAPIRKCLQAHLERGEFPSPIAGLDLEALTLVDSNFRREEIHYALSEGRRLEEAIEYLGERIFTKLATLAKRFPGYFPGFLRELLEADSEKLKRFIRVYLFKTVQLQIAKKRSVCGSADLLLSSALVELARTFLVPIKSAENIPDSAMQKFASDALVKPLFDLFEFEGLVFPRVIRGAKAWVRKELVGKAVSGLTRYRDFVKVERRLSGSEKFQREIQPTVDKLFTLFDQKRKLMTDYAAEEFNDFLAFEPGNSSALIDSALKAGLSDVIEETKPLIEFALNFGAAVLASAHVYEKSAVDSVEANILSITDSVERDYTLTEERADSLGELSLEEFSELAKKSHIAMLRKRLEDHHARAPGGIGADDQYQTVQNYREFLTRFSEKSKEALWLRQIIEVIEELEKAESFSLENSTYWNSAWRERCQNLERKKALFLSLHHFASSEHSIKEMVHSLFSGVFNENEAYLCEELTPILVSYLSLPYSLVIGDTVMQMERWRGDLKNASHGMMELEGSSAFLDSADEIIQKQTERLQILSKKNLFSDALFRAFDKKLPLEGLLANIFILLFDKEFKGDFYTSLKRFMQKRDEMLEVAISQATLGVKPNIIVGSLFSYLLEPYGGKESFLEFLLPAVLRGQGAIAINFAKGQMELFLSKVTKELPLHTAHFDEQYACANQRLQQLDGFSTFQAFVKEQADYLSEMSPEVFPQLRTHLDPLLEKSIPEVVTILLHRALPAGQFTSFEKPFGTLAADLLKLTREAVVRIRNGEKPEVRAPLLLNNLMPLLGGRKELTELLVPETLRGSEAMAFHYVEGLIADFLKELAPDRLPRSEADEPVAEELYQTLLDLGVIPKEIVAAHLEKKRGVIEFLGALLARMRDVINETIPGLVSDPKAVLRLAECALNEIASYLSGEMPRLSVSDKEHQKYLAEAIEEILSPQIASLPLPKDLQPSIKESLGLQIAFQIAEGLKPCENGKKLIRDLMKLSPDAGDEEVVGALESALFSAIAEKIPAPFHYLRIFVLPFIWLLGYLIRPVFRKLVAITSRPDFTSFVRYLLWRLLTFKQVSGKYSGEPAAVKKQLQKVAGHFGFLGSLGAWMVPVKEGKTLPEMVAPLLKVDSTPMPVSILASLTPTPLPPSA